MTTATKTDTKTDAPISAFEQQYRKVENEVIANHRIQQHTNIVALNPAIEELKTTAINDFINSLHTYHAYFGVPIVMIGSFDRWKDRNRAAEKVGGLSLYELALTTLQQSFVNPNDPILLALLEHVTKAFHPCGLNPPVVKGDWIVKG